MKKNVITPLVLCAALTLAGGYQAHAQCKEVQGVKGISNPKRYCQVLEKTRAITVKLLGVLPEDVVPKASVVDDLGADSLDFVELIMNVEQAFHISIPDEEAVKIKTIDDIVKVVVRRMT